MGIRSSTHWLVMWTYRLEIFNGRQLLGSYVWMSFSGGGNRTIPIILLFVWFLSFSLSNCLGILEGFKLPTANPSAQENEENANNSR